MKRFEYFKLNYNMAKNETMIAMILAFVAPVIASLGEKESIRSFLMGTDRPSMFQTVVGAVLIIIAIVVMIRGLIKVAYDNLFGETAQIYSSIPVSLKTVAVTKIAVLTLNMIIVMIGLVAGAAMGYAFGNNPAIESFFDMIVMLATSGGEEKVILLLGAIAVLTTIFFLNAYIFCGFANSNMRPQSMMGKIGILLWAILPVLPMLYIMIKALSKMDSFWGLEEIRILLLVVIAASVVLGIWSSWCSAYWLNKKYYI